MDLIRLFGCQKSGTYYTEFLLEANFQVFVSSWDKHSYPKKEVDVAEYIKASYTDCLRLNKRPFGDLEYQLSLPVQRFVYVVRNPYSIAAGHKKVGRPATAFIRKRWNTLNRAYMEDFLADSTHKAEIKYEDLLYPKDREITLQILQRGLGLTKKQEEWVNIESHAHQSIHPRRKFNLDTSHDFEEEFGEGLTAEEIQIINERLDPEVMKYYGYEYL